MNDPSKSDPELRSLEARLETERPHPAPAFRSELGRLLAARSRFVVDGPTMRRLAPWLAIVGLALLVVSALGAFGTGPLG